MKERLVGASDVAGALVFNAFTQHPYHAPPRIEEAVAAVYASMDTRWFADSRAIWRWLEDEALSSDGCRAILTAWNTPASGHEAPVVFSSQYGGPPPDDDFIDIDALFNNVSRMAWNEAKEFERDREPVEGEAA